MPTIPPIKPVTANYNSVGIINTILEEDATGELAGIPAVENTIESIRMIGQQITGYAPSRNAFASGLVNLIGMMRLYYMLFTNPWSDMKKGKLEMGETIEEIWVGLAEVFNYNPQKSETRVLKRANQEILTAFHSINYHKVYKITISAMELKKAFLSMEGMKNLIEDKMGSLARSASSDEFSMMKYMFALLLLEGKINTITIQPITSVSADDIVTTVATATNLFQFESTENNMAHVENTTPIDNLVIFESAKANAQIKVNSLAAAFNVEYVKFLGQVKMFDNLGKFNWKRMQMIMGEDPNYRQFTSEEIALLNSVDIITCDRNFLQIYDSVFEMETPFMNGEGAFTNYFLHVQQIYSASPFHNIIAYTTEESSVTAISVSPATATVATGGTIGLQAQITTKGFASSEIIWEISTQGVADGTYIGQDGVLHIAQNETKTSITVKATSVYDNSISGSATITVG